ncbi:MAG TPA: M42 family metallopeptidase [Thermoplasmata archaeon]|nr:M42 family metallopeptidase [Thermoplasmata archaeon]
MNKKSSALLENLCNSFGPSGFEGESTRLLRDYVAKYCDDMSADNLGSLLFTKKGTSDDPVVLLPAHIDEVGFIVSSINELGYLTFNPLGDWFDQVLLGQRVNVKTSKGIVRGIIAAKPPHLLPPAERSKLVSQDKMFIDVGASNEDEAKAMGIRVGSPVVPDSSYSTIGKKVFRKGKRQGSDMIAIGKAFDNRSGAFIVAETVRMLKEGKIRHPNTVVGAATTQEEVGLRGARTSAYIVKPDVCLTIDVDLAGDVPGIDAKDAPTKMGLGPSITTYDSSMIPNQGLLEFVLGVADDAKIPYQLSQTGGDGGATDAAIIHISNAGCPTLVIGVPTRHIHAHAGMMSLKDVENTTRLLVEVTKRLDRKTVKTFTAI